MPRGVAQAFKKETRQLNGMPGKNYWQNHAVYNITVDAMPPGRNIKGTENITYFNNSPDTLKVLAVKLFINIHKPGAPRVQPATEDYLTSGVHIDGVSIENQKQRWNDELPRFTNTSIQLPKALLPHDSVHLSINWHYEISLQSGREGMIDSTTYFLAYFYPRIAVYDDYNGWDRMTFTDAQEFYSDFNDYTVTLNVPKNYIVWGTGTLQHPETVLQPQYVQRMNQSLTSDGIVHVVTKEDLAAKNVTAQNATNSWQFKAADIPDMAFGISDHFVWDATSTVVDDATGRRAGANAAFNDTAADYHYVAGFAAHALNWLSHNWPGVPYPYEKTTVFQGYAGMEYPMMANDETYEDTLFSRFVAEHEIAHTYMPFYMGINETRYGFMDEGWATTFELLIGREDLGVERAESFYRQFRINGWIGDKSPDEDLPIITPGDIQSGRGLGNNEYGKPSLGYLAVKDMLGDDLFKKCLHGYMDRWHGKHPLPWDFFNSISDVAGKDLNWFWNNWYFSNYYIDLSLANVSKKRSDYTLTVQNIGGMANPFNVVVNYTDGTTDKIHETASVWQANQKETTVKVPAKKEVKSIVLDGGIYVDADKSNNTWNNN
ncbi:MAG TPA: M1 family metallopeptidase, partial [Chitinophagaceae bacterium]|nr:M1 family metallopeptidase [Chitinophagaceae bacterium]